MISEKEEISFIKIIIIIMMVLIIYGGLFLLYERIWVFLVLGIFIYFMFFIYRDRKMKKDELKDFLKHEKSWIHYKEKLPKEIP